METRSRTEIHGSYISSMHNGLTFHISTAQVKNVLTD